MGEQEHSEEGKEEENEIEEDKVLATRIEMMDWEYTFGVMRKRKGKWY